MPRLRTVRTKEEAAAVPEDEPVTVVIGGDEDKKEEALKSGSRPLRDVEGDVDLETQGAEDGKSKKAKGAEGQPREDGNVQEEDEDQTEALKTQLEELRAAEKASKDLAEARRLENEKLRQAAQAQRSELTKTRAEAFQDRLDMVANAIAAAEAESIAAQQAWEIAAEAQDLKGQSQANLKMQRAQAQLVQYEQVKSQLEAQQAQEKENPPQTEADTRDPIERAVAPLPARAQEWLRAHPEYLTSPRKNAQIQFLHHEAIAQGNEAFSQSYFDWIEGELGMKKSAPKVDELEEEDQGKGHRPPTSAPVSRESPSLKDGRPRSTRITLSPEEREAARTSGISEIEYAEQKMKLLEAKKQGRLQ